MRPTDKARRWWDLVFWTCCLLGVLGCGEPGTSTGDASDTSEGGPPGGVVTLVFPGQSEQVVCKGRLLACADRGGSCEVLLDVKEQGWGSDVIVCQAVGDDPTTAPTVVLAYDEGLPIWTSGMDAAARVVVDDEATAIAMAFLTPHLMTTRSETAKFLLERVEESPYLPQLVTAVGTRDHDAIAEAMPKVVSDVLMQGSLLAPLSMTQDIDVEHLSIKRQGSYLTVESSFGSSVDFLCRVTAIDDCEIGSSDELGSVGKFDHFAGQEVYRIFVPSNSVFKYIQIVSLAVEKIIDSLTEQPGDHLYKIEPGKAYDIQCYSGCTGGGSDEKNSDYAFILDEPGGGDLFNLARVANVVALACDTLSLFVDFSSFSSELVATIVVDCTKDVVGMSMEVSGSASQDDLMGLVASIQGCAVDVMVQELAKKGIFELAGFVLGTVVKKVQILETLGKAGEVLDRLAGMTLFISPLERTILAYEVEYQACRPATCDDASCGPCKKCSEGECAPDYAADGSSCGVGKICQGGACVEQGCADECAGKCGNYLGCDCGSCGWGETCQNNVCVQDCVQICSGKECGSYQGCDCGFCTGTDKCVNNQCLPPGCDELCSGKECGSYQGCECGSCGWGEKCQNNQCVQDCTQVCSGKECGSYQGCECGSCGWGEKCQNNQCVQDCTQVCSGKECGSYQGCDCGFCTGTDKCMNNQCLPPGCDELCSGKECGSYQGCDCGSCGWGEKCENNQCAQDCTQVCSGMECGSYQGCDCGSCGWGEKCQSNQCIQDCTQVCSGKECGSYQGCECGSCGWGEKCQSNQCIQDCAQVCSGKECGSYQGCNCGTCGAGEKCSNNQCVQDCTQVCSGKECGSYQGCNCGTCGAGDSCSNYQCMQDCTQVCSGKECGSYQGCNCGSCSGCASVCSNNQCVADSQVSSGCKSGDLYWKDSCGVLEGKKQDCACDMCQAGECAEHDMTDDGEPKGGGGTYNNVYAAAGNLGSFADDDGKSGSQTGHILPVDPYIADTDWFVAYCKDNWGAFHPYASLKAPSGVNLEICLYYERTGPCSPVADPTKLCIQGSYEKWSWMDGCCGNTGFGGTKKVEMAIDEQSAPLPDGCDSSGNFYYVIKAVSGPGCGSYSFDFDF